jgi:hypothetical protein
MSLKNSQNVSATKGSHLTTCVGHALAYVGRPEANWSRFSFFWGMSLSKRQNATSVVSSELLPPLTTRLASGRHPEIVRALEGWLTIRSEHSDALDYCGRPRRRSHSPRAERMKMKPPSPPSAHSVQTKKKPPGDVAISP